MTVHQYTLFNAHRYCGLKIKPPQYHSTLLRRSGEKYQVIITMQPLFYLHRCTPWAAAWEAERPSGHPCLTLKGTHFYSMFRSR